MSGLLAARPEICATLSLAGRTQYPVLPDIAYRIGGFGGVRGLVEWIRAHNVTALIDATHPFARVMPFHAAAAASEAAIPLLALSRPGWQAAEGDQWHFVASHKDAISDIGSAPRSIFLTVGRLEMAAYGVAPQHRYLVRTVDPVEQKCLPNAVWLNARGPFALENERALLQQHAVEYVITKDSGGEATRAKLLAARQLQLPVILIRRPAKPEVVRVNSAQEAMEWIAQVHEMPL